MTGLIVGIVVFVIIIAILTSCIRIVPQEQTYIIEFLGKYKATRGAGLHLKVPFFERIVRRISLKEQVLDFPPQPVITKDNVLRLSKQAPDTIGCVDRDRKSVV